MFGYNRVVQLTLSALDPNISVIKRLWCTEFHIFKNVFGHGPQILFLLLAGITGWSSDVGTNLQYSGNSINGFKTEIKYKLVHISLGLKMKYK